MAKKATKPQPKAVAPIDPPADCYSEILEPLRVLEQTELYLSRMYGLGNVLRFAGVDLAQKLGQAKDQVTRAVHKPDRAAAAEAIGRVVKGWGVLERKALEHGLTILPPDIVSTLYKGREHWIVTGSRYDAATDQAPDGVRVVHVGELLAAYDIIAERVRLDAIKGQFPGAKLVSGAIPAQGDAMPF
jgi:hypothetical protein